MGLSWLNPLYLTGLLLLALPVMIHLVQKQRSSGIKFPSLMFLKKIPQHEKRRLKIRHRLLLLLRCLLLLLIVLAFARPFFSAATAPDALGLKRSDSVIAIDRSYSMRLGDHWSSAQTMALQMVVQKNAQDRIGIIIFDERAEVISDLTDNADNLRQAIQRQRPGLRSTRLRAAIEQADRLLAGSNASQKRILLISDFQANAHVTGAVPSISRDIELTTYAVNTADFANATVSSVALIPSASTSTDEFSLKVELTNHSVTPLDQQLSLTLNGREQARRALRLTPGSVTTEIFTGLKAAAEPARVQIELDTDALLLDNQAYFVYSGKQRVPVLIIDQPGSRINQSVYLETALQLAQNPAFRIERKPWSALNAFDLPAWAVIIVNDSALPGGELGDALQNFVAAGGGLLIALGEATQHHWPSAADDFLPGTLARRVNAKPAGAYAISLLDEDQTAADTAGFRYDLDLSSTRIFSYRELHATAHDRVLGRYSDTAIALLERPAVGGKVLVLSTTLDPHWNNLALQPGFLPFLHQSLRYLSGYEYFPHGFDIGSVVDVLRYARAAAGGDAIVAAADGSNLIVEPPSVDEIRLERESPLFTITEAGFYQLHRATPADIEVVWAANIDPAEANLERLDLERFVEDIKTAARPVSTAAVITRRQADEYEQQQQLWTVILSVALVLMLLEAFFANWSSAKRTMRT